jgi:hypothetical protein
MQIKIVLKKRQKVFTYPCGSARNKSNNFYWKIREKASFFLRDKRIKIKNDLGYLNLLGRHISLYFSLSSFFNHMFLVIFRTKSRIFTLMCYHHFYDF